MKTSNHHHHGDTTNPTWKCSSAGMCPEFSAPICVGWFLLSYVAPLTLIVLALLFVACSLLMWFWGRSWFKMVLLGRTSRQDDSSRDKEEEDSTGTSEDTVEMPWTELLPHIKLGEYLKIEGATPEGYSFWLIIQPSPDHALFLTAYDFTGTIRRTPAGEHGLATIRPRQCLVLYSSVDQQEQLKECVAVKDEEGDWPSDVACAVSLTNRVDYCQGNQLVCRARTQRLNCKFIKAWDLPTEYALRSAQSNVSMLSQFAMNIVEAKSLMPNELGSLTSGKIYVLGDPWGNAMNFKLEDRHGLRIFQSLNAAGPGGNTIKDIERDLKHRDLVHLRLALKTPEEPGEGQDGDPIVLYREVEEAGIRSQNLSRVNVVVGVTNPDGSTTECLRIQQVEGQALDESKGRIQVEFIASGKGYGAAVWRQCFEIPDHQLVKAIGGGAYGQVWLASNAIGTFHAVKILQRSTFAEERPYEREFCGIQRFMPISRQHPGLVNILHVGRNDAAGFMYCIMEAADDECTAQRINPQQYAPRNLARELAVKGALPVKQVVQLGIDLGEAVGFVHAQGLIHRDIKPENIIFVNGRPKLADIGLVTDMAQEATEVTSIGTAGYSAPEGPGAAAADVYSLGMVLYVACTNCKALQFPDLPPALSARADVDELLYLNKILLRACEPIVRQRYQSAGALLEDLRALQAKLG